MAKMRLKMAKISPKMAKMRFKMAKMRLKMAKIRPKMAIMRFKKAKMRPKITKMRFKMTKMRFKMAMIGLKMVRIRFGIDLKPKVARPTLRGMDETGATKSWKKNGFEPKIAPLPRKIVVFEKRRF